MNFYNREKELDILQHNYQREAGSLFVLYGRRRLGKTALLRAFANQSRPFVYHMADRGSERLAIASLARSLALGLGEPTLLNGHFETWYHLFEAFDRVRDKSRKTVIFLDEYQYLHMAQPAISSMIQKWWDEHWQHERVMLVLCGSAVSMMYKETLAASSPLYGRRTGQLLLRPLPFWEIANFFEGMDAEELIQMWSLTGGVPRYLELAASYSSFQEALAALVLDSGGPLYPEARILLQDEVRKPNVYADLLRVVGNGANRISEIAARMGVAANQLTNYLALLQDLGFVEREVPITEQNPSKSKRGIYRLVDPFLRLWYSCVSPWESLLEFGQLDKLRQQMSPRIETHHAWCFEELCRYFIQARAVDLGIARVGRFWDRKSEIDVVGLDVFGKVAFVGECKWSRSPVSMGVLAALQSKVGELWPETSPTLALFSRNGFTPELAGVAQQQGICLFTPKDMFPTIG